MGKAAFLVWGEDAQEALCKAPRLFRGYIQSKVEEAARQEGRRHIDAAFLYRLRRERMGHGHARQETKRDDERDRVHAVKTDVALVGRVAEAYCRRFHAGVDSRPVKAAGVLGKVLPDPPVHCCPPCSQAIVHLAAKRWACPYRPKPACRACATPCQRADFRAQLDRIMRWGASCHDRP